MKEELYSFRKEIKYIIPKTKAVMIKNRLNSFLPLDDYSGNRGYSVRSLYFESVNNIDFSEKLAGKSHRKKIRLRIYNGDVSLCKLEIKEKQGDRQYKQSLFVSVPDAKELIQGNCDVLKKYFQANGIGLKVYSIMKQGLYRPVVQVEYDRLAYQYPMYDTRITIDDNIRASESNLDIFSSKINYSPVLCEDAILEIKYSDKMMGFISTVLNQFDLEQSAYSKYCAGRRVYYDFNY